MSDKLTIEYFRTNKTSLLIIILDTIFYLIRTVAGTCMSRTHGMSNCQTFHASCALADKKKITLISLNAIVCIDVD